MVPSKPYISNKKSCFISVRFYTSIYYPQKIPNTIVLAVSTKGKPVSFHIEITPSKDNELKDVSYIKCEQVMTISKERLLDKIGVLENTYKVKIDKALNKTLNIG